MGSSFSRWLAPEHTIKLVLLGLDASGKTTVLYKLNQLQGQKEVVTTIPTIGFNVESLHLHGTVFTAWDVGGRDKVRPLWRHYFQGADAFIFVVDSNDTERLQEARDELQRQMNEEALARIPLLILCNKQDLPNALSPEEIVERLDFTRTKVNRQFHAVGCTAVLGTGLLEGLKWLNNAVLSARSRNVHEPQSPEKNVVLSGKHSTEKESSVEKKVTKSQQPHDLVTMLGFDPSDEKTNPTLQHFHGIQQGTQCPFAKAAKLWGGKLSNDSQKHADDDEANAAALTEFVRRSNAGERLDGFCIELTDGGDTVAMPKELGVLVRQTLTALSDKDPAGEGMMRVTYIGARGWRFRFAKADFFVTSFSPCYPASSPRYAFGAGRSFVLLQPELSFLRHNLPSDAPVTFDPPKTIRDKTRLAFRDAGRPYYIPASTKYPPAEHIVKPLHDDGKSMVRWWETEGETKVEMMMTMTQKQYKQ